jgi:hypothetical protein
MAEHPIRLPCCGAQDMSAIYWDRDNGVVRCLCGWQYVVELNAMRPAERGRWLMVEVNNYLRAMFPSEDGRLAWLTGLELLARDEKIFDAGDLIGAKSSRGPDDG